jgi:hypothetical protein
MNHRSIDQRSTQNPLKPPSRTDGAIFSQAALESHGQSKQPFLEDFNMEHSCSNLAVALISFSVTAESMEAAKSRNPCALPTNSPSCVYLG